MHSFKLIPQKLNFLGVCFMSTMALIAGPVDYSATIFDTGSIQVMAPDHALASGAYRIEANEKPWLRWSEEDFKQSYAALQKVSAVWRGKLFSDQFFVIGQQRIAGSPPHHVEIIPFQMTSSKIGLYWQQFKVLWSVSFGERITNEEEYTYIGNIKGFLGLPLKDKAEIVEAVAQKGCAFCPGKVIDSQQVFEGRKVRVLYNYKPVGAGEEKLHFLIVPKEHRNDLKDLTEDEYVETQRISQALCNHFLENRPVHNLYYYHNNGDKIQSVRHWHQHVILTTTPANDWMSKLSFLWKMTFGASALQGDALAVPVQRYKNELQSLSY